MANTAPVVLLIRDGWGLNPNPEHAEFDAVGLARTPVADRLMTEYPWTLVKTCGEDVGLPEGTMGNSEVGHQNIGAGRIVVQESLAMTKACAQGLEHNAAIAAAINHAKTRGTSLHLMGINSDAGVHGQLSHLYALLRACKVMGLSRVYIHLFTDGRDTGPFTGKGYAAQVEASCREIGVGRIASVMGRYYAMDRDNRWERVERAYECLVGAPPPAGGPSFPTPAGVFDAYYASPSGETLKGDEFIIPAAVGSATQVKESRVSSGDAVVFYNYRGDRPRELSAAFVFPDDKWAGVKPSPDSGKPGFNRGPKPDLFYVTMTSYWEELKPYVRIAFPKPPALKNIAGDFWSSKGLTQFRCAETEKYPHVTFFFNDYRDEPFPGERREIIQSPKVATYDLQPEMSAAGVRDAVLRRLAAPDREHAIVVNFANGDMVGHTGSLPAAIKACECVDQCVGAIVDATLKRGGTALVFADHGNAEQMWNPETNSPHTAHTLYDVPLVIVGERFRSRPLRGDRDPAGWFDPKVRASRPRLADVAPTALEIMGLERPPEMTGRSILA